MPILTTNSIQTDQDALDFDADHQQWTIAPGVIASSETDDGVFSAHMASFLFNYGLISSDSGIGVFFTGANDFIYNGAGATISGFTAVSIDGANAEVVNAGAIIGSQSNGITIGINSSVKLHNGGYIYGEGNGVEVDSAAAGALIDNAGRIEGGDDAVYVSTGSAFRTTIHNGGVLQGDEHSVEAQDGAVSLINTGSLIGAVTLADSDDVVRNAGSVFGDIDLGAGNDSFDGRNGTVDGVVFGGGGNDTLVGGAGDDVLQGGAGKDELAGGAGDDALTGGSGADSLAGGRGQDTFVFMSVKDSPVANGDVIADFSHDDGDLIDLHLIDANLGVGGNQAFKFIGTSAFGDHAGELRYDVDVHGNALISGDVDGDGVADFAITATHVSSLVAADFVL